MANPSKQKGTRAETAVVKFMREHGWEAERKALAGNKDNGDIKCRRYPSALWFAVEVKAGKQTENPSRSLFEEWLKQSRCEARNSSIEIKDTCDTAVLIVVKYHRKIKDADVYLQYRDGDGSFTRAHMYLDEFVGDGYKEENEY